jgi:predicted nuclease of predicted toxin-antitoxin system
MRILLDEMMSSKLGRELAGHDVSTVQHEGWAGLTNGALLDAIASRFGVFITMDKGMRYQQHLVGRPFGIIEVRAASNSIRALLPVVPRLRAVIAEIQPGEIVTISALEGGDDSIMAP